MIIFDIQDRKKSNIHFVHDMYNGLKFIHKYKKNCSSRLNDSAPNHFESFNIFQSIHRFRFTRSTSNFRRSWFLSQF